MTLCDFMDVASQAPLSMEFSRQGYWSGLPFPWDLPDRGMESESPVSPALAGGFFTPSQLGSPEMVLEGGRKERESVCLFSGHAGWPRPGLFPNHAHALLQGSAEGLPDGQSVWNGCSLLVCAQQRERLHRRALQGLLCASAL